MKRIGVLLAGCGACDGSDPSESLLTLLALEEASCQPVVLALDRSQFHVVNHLSGEEVPAEARNIWAESARLCREKTYLLDDISPKLLDGLIIPGGQGPLKNLVGAFEPSGPTEVLPAIQDFLHALHRRLVPIGAISLAEFLLTRTFGPFPDGRGCMDVGPEEVLSDPLRALYVTPGNLLAQNLPQLRRGIGALVTVMLESPREPFPGQTP